MFAHLYDGDIAGAVRQEPPAARAAAEPAAHGVARGRGRGYRHSEGTRAKISLGMARGTARKRQATIAAMGRMHEDDAADMCSRAVGAMGKMPAKVPKCQFQKVALGRAVATTAMVDIQQQSSRMRKRALLSHIIAQHDGLLRRVRSGTRLNTAHRA